MSSQALRQLNEFRNELKHLKTILADIQTLRDRLSSLSGNTAQEYVAVSRTVSDPIAETVCELQSLVEDLLEAVIKAKSANRHTLNIISLLKGKHQGQWREVLLLRYIKQLSWREIAKTIERPQSSVRRWHDAAVYEIDKIYLQNGTPMC